jgi:hypothetical protein
MVEVSRMFVVDSLPKETSGCQGRIQNSRIAHFINGSGFGLFVGRLDDSLQPIILHMIPDAVVLNFLFVAAYLVA